MAPESISSFPRTQIVKSQKLSLGLICVSLISQMMKSVSQNRAIRALMSDSQRNKRMSGLGSPDLGVAPPVPRPMECPIP